MNQHNDLLVIGAGISGLSFAKYAANAGLKVTVLEQANRIGGCISSYNPTGDFWLELGTHTCFNTYNTFIKLLQSLQLTNNVRERALAKYLIYDHKLLLHPVFLLYLPALLALPIKLITLSKSGKSVADYYRTLLGKRNYEQIFEPAFSAVVCQPAGGYSAEHLFKNRYNKRQYLLPKSFTFKDGLQTIIYALSNGLNIKTNCQVQRLYNCGKHYIAQTADSLYSARAVCLATPAKIAAHLTYEIAPTIATILNQIPMASVETMGIIIPTKILKFPKLAGLIGRNETFYSVISRDVVPHKTYRGFTFHFRPGIRITDELKLKDIARVLKLSMRVLEACAFFTKLNVLPTLRPGHQNIITHLDTALIDHGISIIGNYITGVAIEDCLLRSCKEWTRMQHYFQISRAQ